MKVFASDYDGTLNQNGPLTNDDLNRIEKFRSDGNKFGIVTGRAAQSILHELDKFKIPYDFIVGINGGLILNSKNEELFGSKLNEKVIETIMQRLTEENVLYYGANDGYGMSQHHVAGQGYEGDINIEISETKELMKNGIKGLFSRTQSPKHAYEIAKRLNDEFETDDIVVFQNAWNLDIGVKGIDKANGLKKALVYLGIADAQVFTVGDGHNDLPMLKEYNGFVMKNASDDIKSECGNVVNSVIEALEIVMEK